MLVIHLIWGYRSKSHSSVMSESLRSILFIGAIAKRASRLVRVTARAMCMFNSSSLPSTPGARLPTSDRLTLIPAMLRRIRLAPSLLSKVIKPNSSTFQQDEMSKSSMWGNGRSADASLRVRLLRVIRSRRKLPPTLLRKWTNLVSLRFQHQVMSKSSRWGSSTSWST